MPNNTVVIIAGEASGDILGAGLMQALLAKQPNLKFEGVGGPQMVALGFKSIVPMERLSVMGLVEVLGRLPELLRLRRRLFKRYIQTPPLAMIGIDAPDFNLALETRLKAQGIACVHYVSPSVWAWREERVFTVAKACHQVLCLLPFELPYYERHSIPATFVGHPLADTITGDISQQVAKQDLKLNSNPVLALMPGSRAMEVKNLGPDFLQTALLLQTKYPHLQIVVAAANEQRRAQIKTLLEHYPKLKVTVCLAQSHQVLAASDAVLVASGTATLEALLFEKPMLVCYRMSKLSFKIFKRKLKVEFVSLPNLLAGKKIVQELLQEAVAPKRLVKQMEKLLFDETCRKDLCKELAKLHQVLACNADDKAADAVLSVIASQSLKDRT